MAHAQTTAQDSVLTRRSVHGPVAAYIAFVMELTLIPMLLPGIQAQFGLSVGALAWVFNSYGIAVAVGVLLGGVFGDAFNTRRIFSYGVSFFVAGSILMTVSETYVAVLMSRALQGFGAGIFSPLVPLLLTRASPDKPGKALIVWGSVAGYIAAFAPLVFSSLFGEGAWKIALAVIAATATLAVILPGGAPDEEEQTAHGGPRLRYGALLKVPNLWLAYIYVFCTYGAISYYLFRLPVWLTDQEASAVSVGFALSVLWLTFSGLSTVLRNLVDSPKLVAIMVASPLMIALGLPLSSLEGGSGVLLISSVLVGAGLACSNAPSTQVILRFAPRGMRAISSSLDITFARLGGIAAVALLAESAIEVATLAVALLCLAAALCALVVSRRRPAQDP